MQAKRATIKESRNRPDTVDLFRIVSKNYNRVICFTAILLNQILDTDLTNFRDIEKSRFEIINGGYREKFTVEFWLAPKSRKAPELMPTLTEKDIKFSKGKPKNIGFQQPNC